MSYLAQLKKVSEERQEQDKANQLQAQQQREQRKKLFRTQVKPTLERMREFLRELTDQLNYLKPDTPVSYDIKAYGEITDFKQQNYRVALFDNIYGSTKKSHHSLKNSDFIDTSSDFLLRCICETPYKYRLKKHNLSDANLQRKYFAKYHISFIDTEESDPNSEAIKTIFLFEPKIIVEFKLTGQFKSSTIDLIVTNFAELGKKVVYSLQPKEINETFLDELAKYITRQPHHLNLRQKNPSPNRNASPPQKEDVQSGVRTQKADGIKRGDNQPVAKTLQEEQIPKPTRKKNGWFRFFRK